MRLRLLFCFFLATAPTEYRRALGSENQQYSQQYVILINGEISGKETVQEQVSGAGNVLANSTHEILVSDGVETKRMAFTTSLSLQKGAGTPISYTCRYSSGEARDSYEVAVHGTQVVRALTRNGRSSETAVQLQPGFVIVDFNVYYQYDYLLRKYDLKKGGRQSFVNFLPVIAAEIPVALTRLEDSTLGNSDKPLEVHNFRIEFGNSWLGIVSSDKDGRFVRLLIQEKGLEVVRRNLLP